MSLRKCAFPLLLLAVLGTALPVQAQFTPRFSRQEAASPVQWHIGIGVTALNLGDYSSERWSELDAPLPIFQLHGAVMIPLGTSEEWFLMPELEGNIALPATRGVYVDPMPIDEVTQHEVPTIGQRGFSIMLNLVRSLDDRRTLFGAGFGYHLIEHDPVMPASMVLRDVPFINDPFQHLGIGMQLHAARAISQLSDKTRLMLEARYKYAYMGGNTSGRTLLMSELQLTAYLAIK